MDQQLLIEEFGSQSSKKIFSIKNDDSIQKHPLNLMSKYNLFIYCYNQTCNRVDEKTLLFVKQSRVFGSLDFMLSKPSFIALLVLSFIVPVLGVFMTGYLSMAAYKKNEQRVKDPFKNMRFDHVKCSQLKKNYHFIKINFKSLNSEFNFKENVELAESQRKSGQTSQWMIYNEVFSSYYTDFPKYKIKLIVILTLGIVLSLSSMIFFVILV